jgi:hypothetical protein
MCPTISGHDQGLVDVEDAAIQEVLAGAAASAGEIRPPLDVTVYGHYAEANMLTVTQFDTNIQHKFAVGMVKCPLKSYEGGRPEKDI